jgi:ketopantoate reductase
MKILVVGTGIIGTTWGWALSNAGLDVTHLVRPGYGAQASESLRSH